MSYKSDFQVFIFYLSIGSWRGCELVRTATILSGVASATFLIWPTRCCEVIRAATLEVEFGELGDTGWWMVDGFF